MRGKFVIERPNITVAHLTRSTHGMSTPPVEALVLSRRSPGWRFQGVSLFLTYPQCPMSLEDFKSAIIALFGANLSWAVLCRESHADGTPHLHGVIKFTSRERMRGYGLLDGLTGQHGNYCGVRSLKHCVRYLLKGDEYCGIGCDPEELETALWSKTSSKAAIACQLLKAGKSMKEIDDELPGYVLLNYRKLCEYQSWLRRHQPPEIATWSCLDVDLVLWTVADVKIANWLNVNLFRPREFKQKQLYVWGPHNSGKTSLALRVHKYCRVYWMPHENFYDEWEGDRYDIVILDEFKGQKPISFMNMWLQGAPMSVAVKHRQTVKLCNLPMIILSNYSLEEAYSGVAMRDSGRLEALATRLEIVEVAGFIKVLT